MPPATDERTPLVRQPSTGFDNDEDDNVVDPINSTAVYDMTGSSARSRSRSRSRDRWFPLRHSNSISQADFYRRPDNERPVLQRLMQSHYTVTNPFGGSPYESLAQSSSSLNLQACFQEGASVDLESNGRRMSILGTMRPQRLIGDYVPFSWESHKVDTMKMSKGGKKDYYDSLNELVERYQEIDKFLDMGKVHLNILSNYTKGKGDDLPPLIEGQHFESFNLEHGESTNSISENGSQNPRKNLKDIPGGVNEGSMILGLDEEADAKDVYVAIMVNFLINFLLLIGKVIVTMLTNSISVVASLVDSILDFLSTFIIFIANRLSSNRSWKTQHLYPVGRTRLEPLGILIFSVIIIISFFQVAQESAKRLFFSSPADREAAKIGLSSVAIMLVTIAAKVGCWIWCASSPSSSVQALAQDAWTDIVFNSVSLAVPTLGYYMNVWWLDPAGALFLSGYIIYSWCATAFGHIDNLTGAVADTEDYKAILYLAYRFANPIKSITALQVYHVGDNLNVEIDIVFDQNDKSLSFEDYHDIAEALQYAIETLPMVERAYVHIDYMEGNFKGHLK
ncbi:uncharacterized protein KQ657_000768 [Scheffersomyces spartinae]|uniref:Cation efflux protein transmembrane domain-containing protein n=1 Tax=Scheffersomyces spartinae TaxID=45513 RepID=A0A9P8AIP8_9ASCO|nr:uncharacterized protein KQ657_000768 [Scheffersomyces spartinae]KAG7193351.1 hypothetical protein KQ657_000768 [Scheffersomyces spartinae]